MTLEEKRKKHALYMREWVRKNPEKKKAIDAKSHLKHREARLAAMREYGSGHQQEQKQRSEKHYQSNRQKMIDNASKWNRENNEIRNTRMRVWAKQKSETDISFRLLRQIRSRIWYALKARASKSARTEKLLGCSVDQLKLWLELWMKPGMSWENYGEWHIDHKEPCAKFDLTKPEEQRACFHYTNLQPLWAKENLSKGAK